ncbi:MAG: HEAT repeat domain-containing protein, partial [Candidatus Riflebacteria bacterium]|nr:HEAT repeat domain-containing protein [Candidatus Riflebacteria bacterium]
MPIDLKKLAQDVLHSDVDLRILAMQTLLRLEGELVRASSTLIGEIRRDLEKLVAETDGDSKFFARQCLDHINKLSPTAGQQKPAESGRTARPAPPGPPEPPRPVAAQAPSPPPPPPQQATTDLGLLQTGDKAAQLATLGQVAQQKLRAAAPKVTALLGAKTADAEVLAAALSCLAKIGQAADLAQVQPLLKHADGRVRANAVEVVEALAPKEQQVSWLSPLAEDPVDRVRANVLKALGTVGQETIYTVLETM